MVFSLVSFRLSEVKNISHGLTCSLSGVNYKMQAIIHLHIGTFCDGVKGQI